MSATSKDGVLAVCGSFIVLSGVAVGLRFYGRKHQGVDLRTDDWTALAGVITYIATCGIIFHWVQEKYIGYSSTDFTSKELAEASDANGKIGYAFDFLNQTTLALVKLSALFFYRRVFHTGAGVVDWFNRIVVALIAIVICWYITFQFLAAFQCPGHFSATWTGTSAEYCTLNFVWALGFAISDFLLDLIILLVPIHRVWKLNANTKRKLSIIGVFCLAFVGLGASVARLVIYVESELGGTAYYYHHDPERTVTEIAFIQMLEAGISVTAINLPSLWNVCTSTLPNKFTSSMKRFHSRLGSVRPQRSRPSSDEESFKHLSHSGRMDNAEETRLTKPQYPPSSFRGDRESLGHSFKVYAKHAINDEETGEKLKDGLTSNV